MNYKKIAKIEFFLNMATLGIFLKHDSFHMFLAIAAAMLAYFFAAVFSSKKARFLFFVPVSIVVCQLSVTLKRGIMEQGFKEALRGNPFGYLVADMIYGFKHVVITAMKAFWGFTEAVVYDRYSSIESLNYRFFTIIVMIVIMTIFILKSKSPELEVVAA